MKLGRRWVGIVLAESGAGRGRVQPGSPTPRPAASWTSRASEPDGKCTNPSIRSEESSATDFDWCGCCMADCPDVGHPERCPPRIGRTSRRGRCPSTPYPWGCRGRTCRCLRWCAATPSADGLGTLGFRGRRSSRSTQTFLVARTCKTEVEARRFAAYLRTKFVRTQHRVA